MYLTTDTPTALLADEHKHDVQLAVYSPTCGSSVRHLMVSYPAKGRAKDAFSVATQADCGKCEAKERKAKPMEYGVLHISS